MESEEFYDPDLCGDCRWCIAEDGVITTCHYMPPVVTVNPHSGKPNRARPMVLGNDYACSKFEEVPE